MSVRTEEKNMFSAYRVTKDEMMSKNLSFSDNIKVSMDNISSRLSGQGMRKIYHDFFSLKDEWNLMIEFFRMYMTSKSVILSDREDENKKYESAIEMHSINIKEGLSCSCKEKESGQKITSPCN